MLKIFVIINYIKLLVIFNTIQPQSMRAINIEGTSNYYIIDIRDPDNLQNRFRLNNNIKIYI